MLTKALFGFLSVFAMHVLCLWNVVIPLVASQSWSLRQRGVTAEAPLGSPFIALPPTLSSLSSLNLPVNYLCSFRHFKNRL